MNKTSFILGIFIVLAFFVITSVSAADDKVPDLVGTWKHVFVEADSELTNYTNATMNETSINKFVIETQNGPVFEGYKEISPIMGDKSVVKEGFTGVLSNDFTQAYIKEHEDGFSIVDITSPDTLTVYLMYDLDPHGGSDSGIARINLVRLK